MYVLPFLVVLVIALAIFFSPLLAVLLFVLAAVAIGGGRFFGRKSSVEPANAPPEQPRAGAGPPTEVEAPQSEGGIWGETWPDEREQRSA